MRKIIAVLLFGFMLTGCSGSMHTIDENVPEKATASPLLSPSPHQLYTWGDLDGDSLADKAEIKWEGNFASPFNITVSFGTGDVKTITISDEIVDSTAKIHISDVNNDGKTEIVLPNIGGTDTLGTVSCLLIGYDEGKLFREDVFGEGFFGRGSDTYTVIMDDSYNFKVKNNYTGNEIRLSGIDMTGFVPGKEVFFTSYTVNGNILESLDGKNGIMVTSWLEYGVYDEADENTIMAQPCKIYSTLMWENGRWNITDEKVEGPPAVYADPAEESGEKYISLPKNFDPLGIFTRLDKYKNNLPLFITNAKDIHYKDHRTENYKVTHLRYKPIPNTYQIHNVSIGGYDAKTIIKTENGKVIQVYTSSRCMNELDNVYEQVRQALGEPDVIYGYDKNWDYVQIDEYRPWPEFCKPRWDMENYVIEINSYPDGNMDAWWYIAAYYKSKSSIHISHYYENGLCCPHENDMAFDENCIYFEEGLIGKNKDGIIAKYKAEPANSSYYDDYPGHCETKEYIIEDTEALGCKGYINIRYIPLSIDYKYCHEYIEVSYVLDVTDKSISQIHTICDEARLQLTAALEKAETDYIISEDYSSGIDQEQVKAAFLGGTYYKTEPYSEINNIELYSWYIEDGNTSVHYRIRGKRDDQSPTEPHTNKNNLYISCNIDIEK